jgi:hypothetical protein
MPARSVESVDRVPVRHCWHNVQVNVGAVMPLIGEREAHVAGRSGA